MKKRNKGEKLEVKETLKTFIRKYSTPAFAIATGILISMCIYLAISFSLRSTIEPLLAAGFICDSLAAGIALVVSFLGASRRWYIPAIEVFLLGMVLKLFALF